MIPLKLKTTIPKLLLPAPFLPSFHAFAMFAFNTLNTEQHTFSKLWLLLFEIILPNKTDAVLFWELVSRNNPH